MGRSKSKPNTWHGKPVYVTGLDGTLYVRAAAIMGGGSELTTVLVASYDKTPLYFFDKGMKVAYLKHDDAIAWVKKECEQSPRFRKEAMYGMPGTELLAGMERYKRKYEAGECKIVD